MADSPAKTAALATVTRQSAAASRPVIDPADLSAIVDAYAMTDAAGLAPTAPGWDPVYDTNGATAEVWRTKAALVAGDYTFSADDATYNKGDVLANMLAMETKYALLADAATAARLATASTLSTNGAYTTTLDQVAAVVIP